MRVCVCIYKVIHVFLKANKSRAEEPDPEESQSFTAGC